eukprot:3593790-Lingulodinium_polyedra.AAC.1
MIGARQLAARQTEELQAPNAHATHHDATRVLARGGVVGPRVLGAPRPTLGILVVLLRCIARLREE